MARYQGQTPPQDPVISAKLSHTSGLNSAPLCALSYAFLSLTPSGDAPSPWLALGAFIGLPLALWVYKCIMLVLFQRKIIYMGYVPLDARSQELNKDISPAKGIKCEEILINGERNIRLYGILVRRDSVPPSEQQPKAVIVYFQGNAGNPLGRLPLWERLILGTSLSPGFSQPQSVLDSTAILAIAPRSYWKSTKKTPTERGIISDYLSALNYASLRFPSTPIILYGHSLGGAAAVCLSAQVKSGAFPHVQGLILENPFASIPWMVKALYPQKWLPYHYLGGFAFDKWDALSAMRDVREGKLLDRLRRDVLVVLSQKDEIVPNEMGKALYEAAQTGSSSEKSGQEPGSGHMVNIPSALHDNAWTVRQWRREMELYILSRTSKMNN
ncbi:Alpha/Beta hydrolase protein [Irpex rosettiformis]|uniref:Alpha/Beta hydrolase protein n=1 Tax=Irpex rosettiformis TaxID=378272 RepID=A0ACB8TXX3_9APHY|nr:Alpha/Beta hydrolase protein [Irpex rosettiformis]